MLSKAMNGLEVQSTVRSIFISRVMQISCMHRASVLSQDAHHTGHRHFHFQGWELFYQNLACTFRNINGFTFGYIKCLTCLWCRKEDLGLCVPYIWREIGTSLCLVSQAESAQEPHLSNVTTLRLSVYQWQLLCYIKVFKTCSWHMMKSIAE